MFGTVNEHMYIVMCICNYILRIAVCMRNDNLLYVTLDVMFNQNKRVFSKVGQGCVRCVNL